METAFESPSGLVPIRLENVAFMSSFVTSLVSQSTLGSKGVHFDTGGPRLYQNGVTKFLLHRNGGHFTFSAAGPPHLYPAHATKLISIPATNPTAFVSQTSRKQSDSLQQRPNCSQFYKLERNFFGGLVSPISSSLIRDIKSLFNATISRQFERSPPRTLDFLQSYGTLTSTPTGYDKRLSARRQFR